MDNQVNHARAGMDVLAALQGGAAAAPDEATASTGAPPKPRRSRATVPVASPPPTPEAPARVAAAPVDGAERLQIRRTGSRRLSALMLVVTVPLTAFSAWAAVTTRDTTLGGVALILGALSLCLWCMRAITVTTSVSLLGPRLEVRQGGRRYVWDLASPYSPVDHVRGRPGRPGWQVVLRNADGSTFALDGSMVPAKRFTEILSRYRPEL